MDLQQYTKLEFNSAIIKKGQLKIYLTKQKNICIIKIGNKHTEMYVANILAKHYIAVPKQNVVFLFIPYLSTICI